MVMALAVALVRVVAAKETALVAKVTALVCLLMATMAEVMAVGSDKGGDIGERGDSGNDDPMVALEMTSGAFVLTVVAVVMALAAVGY